MTEVGWAFVGWTKPQEGGKSHALVCWPMWGASEGPRFAHGLCNSREAARDRRRALDERPPVSPSGYEPAPEERCGLCLLSYAMREGARRSST